MQKIQLIAACCMLSFALMAQPNISRVEYFFNSDPGPGNATDIPVIAANNIADQTFAVSIAGLPAGINTLFLRSQDANGKWSITNAFLFVKFLPAAGAINITKAEYFIDHDPGLGNANNVALPPASNVVDHSFNISIAGLSDGFHVLFMRSRDAAGKWSSTNYFIFIKQTPAANPADIVSAEYFIDSDPGFGFGIPVSLNAATDVVNIPANINISNLESGIHQLYLRSKNANGKWSVPQRWTFVKVNNQLPDINAIEYFLDTDPGIGKGVPIAINSSSNIADYVSPVNITGLSVGTHRLFIRSRSVAGKWSISNVIEFPVNSTVSPPAINTNGITGKTFCGDNNFQLSFHATGTYNPGNVFAVQLSDASGNFDSPLVIGSNTSTSSGIIACKIPLHITNSSGYRTRVVSSDPVVAGAISDTIFTLFDQPRFNDTTLHIVCTDETVDLTSTFTTAGYSVSWSVGNPTMASAGIHQMISSNTSLCKDTALLTVIQDVAIWTGSVSSDWHLAANWSTGRIPYEKTHVIINAGAPNNCVISAADVSIASLQVKTGAVLNAINNRQVNITANCQPLPIHP